MPENADAREAVPGAAAACTTKRTPHSSVPAAVPQLYDSAGIRLPSRRSPIVGQPRLATPSWHRLAVERWAERPA